MSGRIRLSSLGLLYTPKLVSSIDSKPWSVEEAKGLSNAKRENISVVSKTCFSLLTGTPPLRRQTFAEEDLYEMISCVLICPFWVLKEAAV